MPHAPGWAEGTWTKTLFPVFRRILKALRVEWRNSMLRFVSTPEGRNENIKYIISSSGNRNHYLLRLQSRFVPLGQDEWPLL